MKLKSVIRTVAPIAAVLVAGVVLSDTYRGIRELPPKARMQVVTPLSKTETTVNDKALPEKLAAPHVVIYKSKRRLELYDGTVLLRSYPVALGRTPRGDKAREGDGATPEGTFFICTKNAKSRYNRFLGLSYPNIEDATRGARTGLIKPAELAEIRKAIEQGKRPPWDTKLGGQIGIHGGGTARDWTQGCIAIPDEAIEEIFEVLPYGTVVVVKP